MRDRKSDAHRALTQARLGRKLGPNETIHHKNEDKTDNSATNHETKPRGKHTAEHNVARGTSKLRASLRMEREGKKLY